MASSKPTVIFVPGAWHGPDAFGNVRKQLESHDYPTVGISLPSVGAEPPLKSWDKDVDTIQIAVKDVADKGGDVVLVMHSYGALPSCEAAKGFVKMQREKKGMKGGIVRLVYLCSVVLPERAVLMGLTNNEPAPWLEIDVIVLSFACLIMVSSNFNSLFSL